MNATLHLRCTPGRALFIAGTMTEQRRTIPEATGPLGLGYVDCPDSGQLRYSDELGGPGLRPGWATVTFTVQDGGYGGPAVARVARWVVIPR